MPDFPVGSFEGLSPADLFVLRWRAL